MRTSPRTRSPAICSRRERAWFLDALAAKFTGAQCQAIEAKVQETKAQLRQASEYLQQQSIGEIRAARRSP